MIQNLLRFGTGVAFLMILLSPMAAQEPPNKEKAPPGPRPAVKDVDEYRQYFKKPETADDYWKAMQFEIDVGQYDLAARLLHGLIAKPPTEDELLQLEAKYTMGAFLKLRGLPRWSSDDKVNKQAIADVEELIKLVTAAVKRKLGDRERIVKYVRALAGEPEEAAFALKQLYFYRALAVPPLIDVMRTAPPDERRALRKALTQLPDVVPPLIAALDSNDPDLILDVLTVFRERGAKETVPHLWYLSAAPSQPKEVRDKATAALAYFLNVPPSKLPLPRVELMREAERYYQHQVAFADPKAVIVWRWDKTTIVQGWPGAETVPATKAEEYYGLHYARQALALDPTYQPAQETLLSLALEKTLENTDLSQPLSKTSPSVHDLLTTINPDVLVAVLERAMQDKRSTVVLACVRALGELVEVRASKPTGHGEPALVKALNYKDKRVQMSAAESLLRMPNPPSSEASQRILEILKSNLGMAGQASAKPKAIVAAADAESRVRIARAVTEAGYEPVPVGTGRDALRRINSANDISAIVLESTLPDPGLASFLAQVRADVNAGRLPVVLIAVPDTAESRDLIAKYRDERERSQFIINRTAAFRKQRLDLQIKYEQDRDRLLKSNLYENKDLERQENLAALETRHKEELRDLTKQYAEAFLLDQKAQEVERQLQVLANKYSVECQRREDALKRWLEGSPTITVVSASYLEDPKKLQSGLQGEEGKTETNPLSPAEQTEYAEKSIHDLARMARGEIKGYDFKQDELVKLVYNSLRAGKLSEKGQADAIDVVAHVSAGRSQLELADVALDERRPLPLRLKATDELIQHIQQNSLMLDADHKTRLRKLYEAAGTVPELKELQAKLAVLQGSFHPDPRVTGERLRDFQPPSPGGPPKVNP